MGDEVDIKCGQTIPVGIRDGPCPTVYAVCWNPSPEDIVHRPTSKGTSLAWHKDGEVLAAATNGWGNIPGTLSILEYNGKNGFRTRTALQCPEGESISSLCWAYYDSYLILALQPSSTLCFFEATDNDPKRLKYMGNIKYADHFHEGSELILAPDLTLGDLLVYNREKLVVLDHPISDVQAWKISKVMKAPIGILGCAYDSGDIGLFTIEREKWSYWEMTGAELRIVASSTGNELDKRKGSKRRKFDSSEYRSIAVSRSGKFFAAGGHDSLSFHEKQRDGDGQNLEMVTLGCRPHYVNFGYVNCIQFNPGEISARMLALGGDTGYISIWAIDRKDHLAVGKKGKESATDKDRQEEHDMGYYSSRTFSNADRQDDELVEEFHRPCIKIRREEVLVVTAASSKAAEDVTAPEGHVDVVQNVAAVNVSMTASTSSDQVDVQGKAEDRSNVTLADQLESVKEEVNEQKPEASGRLVDIADQAVHNLMSIGARAEDLLSRIGGLTPDQVKDFLEKEVKDLLEKASAAQRGRL